jgi:hypothetical protein
VHRLLALVDEPLLDELPSARAIAAWYLKFIVR